MSRFALLFNGSSLEPWHLRCLDHLEESANLAGVILTTGGSNLASRTIGSPLMRFYASLVGNRETVDVSRRFAEVSRFCGDQHWPIQPREFDFVLKLGPGSIPKGIGPATRHGVWCFPHETEGDLLPFFREVYDGEDVTEASLLAVDGPGGDTRILEQGCFRTEKRSYIKNRDCMQDSIAEWPERVCRRLARADLDFALVPARSESTQHRLDQYPRLLSFWGRITYRRLRFAWNRLFRHPQWNIGVLRVPINELLSSAGYKDTAIEWFPLDDRERFLADPFGIASDGAIQVLCEHFAYRSGKGHICTFEYSDQGFSRQTMRAIDLPVHMSYPYLVEDEGKIYCIPETSYADEISLFQAEEFPHRWSKVAVLIEHFGGVDPTVFRHDGRWWLMCTEKGRGADNKLYVWHASDLLGPWTAHARNPVKTDVRTARPGGVPFVHDGVLYRPTQDCSKVYGWRIAIQRVRSLTPSEFIEEPVTVLEASPDSPFPLGRHTLTTVGNVVLIDGHRTVFVWHSFRSFLRTWARDLSRKLRRR